MQRVHSGPHFSPERARRPAPWRASAGKSLHTKLRLQPLVPTHAPLGRGRSAHVRDRPTRAVGPFAIRSRPRRAIEQRLVAGWGRRRARGGSGAGGGAQRAGADYDWPRCAGAWPRAAGRGWSRRPRDSRLLAVHLRADARVLEPGLVTVPVAMSRFKVSKFRHTEARPPRREVSPARRPPPPSPRSPSAPRRPLQARDRRPGRPVVTRPAVSAAPGTLSGRSVSPAGGRPACPAPGPRGGIAHPASPRPEARKAACLLGFRSSSPGSRGSAASGASSSSLTPSRSCPGLGCGRCPFLPWP